MDHTINSHVKEDSEGVCSQLAALSTGKGVVGQTSYGVTDSPATLHDASYCSEQIYGSEMPILIQSINHLANSNRLPIPEPNIYKVEPFDYPEWKAAFHALNRGG